MYKAHRRPHFHSTEIDIMLGDYPCSWQFHYIHCVGHITSLPDAVNVFLVLVLELLKYR